MDNTVKVGSDLGSDSLVYYWPSFLTLLSLCKNPRR